MNPWGARREGASATESLIVSNKPSKVSTAAGAELAAASINALLDSVNKIAVLGGGSNINPDINSALNEINNVAKVLVAPIASISSTQSGSAQNKDSAADANPANPVFSFH